MKPRDIFVFLGTVTLLRMVWLSIQGICPEEAYFWMCGTRLAPAFFDGPPGTAFLVWFLGVVSGSSLEVVRLAWPLMGFIAAWLAWLLARTLFNDLVAAWTVVALNALPFFNNLSVTIGPGAPLMIFTLSGTLAAFSAIESRRVDWLLAAALLSLACLFRYDAVLVPCGFLIAVIAVSGKSKKPDLMVLGSLVLFPVAALYAPLAWNASLEWVPIAGGTLQTWWRPQPGGLIREFLEYIRQFSLLFGIALPVAFGTMCWNAWRERDRGRFLLVAGAPAGMWACYQMLIGRDFLSAAWIATVPLLIYLAHEGVRWRRIRLAGSATILIALLSSGFLLHEESLKRSTGKILAAEMHAAMKEIPASDGGGFLIAENADLAAVLAMHFKSPSRPDYPPVFVPESPALTSQFGIWPSYANFIDSEPVDEFFTEQKGRNPFMGHHALYMGQDLPQTIKGAFTEVRPLRTITLPDGRKMVIHLCLDYQTLPL